MKSIAIRPRTFQLKKGLSSKDAYRAVSKRARGDFRAIRYNKKTGRCTVV